MPRLPVLLLLLTGCFGQRTPKDAVDDTDPVDTDVVDTDVPTPPTPPVSTFREGSYHVDYLAIRPESDVDGDGVTDNKLVEVLSAVDGLFPGASFNLTSINDALVFNLDGFITVVLLDASSDGDALELSLLQGTGTSVADLAVAPGAASTDLLGSFTAEETFLAGPGTWSLPITVQAGALPVPLTVREVRLEGALTAASTSGTIYGVLPVQDFVDQVVDPNIPPEGFGAFTKQQILDLVMGLAPGFADVDLGGGELGVTGAFTYHGTAASF